MPSVFLIVYDSFPKEPQLNWFVLFLLGMTALVFFGFLFSFLDFVGGPILNDIAAKLQQLYFKITSTYFSTYIQIHKKTLPQQARQILFEQLLYYKKLNVAERKAFDHRVVRFNESRTFTPKENVLITEEMKLLISATAVQISFGLRSYLVKEFSHIHVYPQAYLSKISQRYHKGEVNPSGLVLLNWEDFYHGIQVPDDNLNLGIHEFAHTLAVQRLKNRAYRDQVFVKLFDKLMRSVSNPVFRKQIQQRAGLRKYAMTNPMEFFAVTTEAFFENPEKLYVNHPTIFQLFAEMYNQDLISLYRREITPLTKSAAITSN